jgi:predicted nucleic acid-binding protein
LKAYADSSVLVSLYLDDGHSDKAIAWMKRQSEPLPFTQLHRHELRNAIRLAVWRKQMDSTGRRKAFLLLDQDLKDKFLVHRQVTWADVFREAERIGEAQTESTGLRAADLLHIAIASCLASEEFLTFDAVQRRAAMGAGLKCRE